MTITCFIRYEIDPFQRNAFKEYAENWGASFPGAEAILLATSFPTRGRITSHGG